MPALFEALPKEFVSDAQFYEYKTPVTETMDKVRKLGVVVVLRDREYFGLVDDRSLFREQAIGPLKFSKSLPVGKFARKLPVLDSSTSLGMLINYFHDFSAKALPYQEGSRITGVVRRDVVVSTILSLHMLAKAKVADMMSSPIISIPQDSSMAQARNAMEKNKIARVVVLDAKGRLSGVISQRDIADRLTKPEERLPERKSYAFSPSNISAASIMRAPVYTIDADRRAEDAAKMLLENRISALVVTKNSVPVGVVSIRDIIESAAAATAKTQSRVMVSGLDEYTGDYEQAIRDSMNRLVSKIDRFGHNEVDYVSVNVKRHRERNYELHARLALRKRGVVFAHANGYNLESTLDALLDSIYKRVRTRKESFLSNRRLAERHYEERE
ncbi:MAG: CBS domain-containing protein [Candidatus Micrarchaeota archaeon]|nr:CBS domain-containing protein [Candidatus Micrarchaeota archaeon]